jgi:ADYC domain
MNACLSMLCLISACSGTSAVAPPPPPQLALSAPPDCREDVTPATCASEGPIGFGGPQGNYLEGPALERLHFTSVPAFPGIFPPPAGTKLEASATCEKTAPGQAMIPQITVDDCVLQTAGAALCHVDADVTNICTITGGDSGLRRRVTIVRGFWDATGAWVDVPGVVTLSCNADRPTGQKGGQSAALNGAVAKCAHFDPATRRDAFLACIRMERADYCGDGHPHTVNGTDIYAHDLINPMTAAECQDGRCFEASWSKDGAICIARPRWVGPGMGYDQCSDQFTPSDLPGIVCRAPSDTAVLFSRSAVHACASPGSPRPCGSDTDPVCKP